MKKEEVERVDPPLGGTLCGGHRMVEEPYKTLPEQFWAKAECARPTSGGRGGGGGVLEGKSVQERNVLILAIVGGVPAHQGLA